MPLLLTFLGVAVAVATLLWAAAVLIQPYLYSTPSDRLPLRAAVGGLLVGSFLTFWTYANTRADHPDKYGTLFEFTPTATKEITEFDAVRRLNQKGPDGQWKEQTVAYHRVPTRAATEFVTDANPPERYRPNTGSYMTVAVLVPEGNGAKTRFDAALDSRGQSYLSGDQKVFREKGTKRYVEVDVPGAVYAPSTGAALLALLLNLTHFALWVAVLGPVMRYGGWESLTGAAALGTLTMLMVMPLLFDSNRPPAPAGAVANAGR